MADVSKKMTQYTASVDRIKKMEDNMITYNEGRIPAGEPKFSSPEWGPEMDQVFGPAQLGEYKFEVKIPVGTTARKALEMLYYGYHWGRQKVEQEVNIKKQVRLKPLVDARLFVNRCVAKHHDSGDMDEFGLELDNDYLELNPSNKVKEEIEKIAKIGYKTLLSKMKLAKQVKAKEAKKAEDEKKRLGEEAGRLKPHEVMKGVVKQVLQEQSRAKKSKTKDEIATENKLKSTRFEIDYTGWHFADEAEEIEDYINERPRQKKRKWTKKELAEWKNKNHLQQKNDEAQAKSLGGKKGKKGKDSAKGKGKGKSDGKGPGKDGQAWNQWNQWFQPQKGQPKGKSKGKTGKGVGKASKGKGSKGKGKGKSKQNSGGSWRGSH
eukprot:6076888-Karenia_brevis.AAC.1